jgi:multidrug resistance efflux pump/predicted flap endonuclease-1-like 5' DNA nuclease
MGRTSSAGRFDLRIWSFPHNPDAETHRAVCTLLNQDEIMESPIIAQLPRGHRMDRQFGVVYDITPDRSDDLTLIDGIRTREVVMLNQLGIYLYGQIALWRQREVTAIAAELQVPESRIINEGWMDQAYAFCRREPRPLKADLPASVSRTVTLLICALMVGFLAVYFLKQQRNETLTGVLSADVTSVCVPARAKLTEVRVKPGDEVFSGQPLLTLEKLEHLELIGAQEKLVQNLQWEMRRIEAMTAIEVEWRSRDLDREIARYQTQIAQHKTAARERIQEALAEKARKEAAETVLAIEATTQATDSSKQGVRLASATGYRKRPGGLMFFSASAQEPQRMIAATPVPATAPAPAPVPVPTPEPMIEDVPKPLAEPAPVRIAMAPESSSVIDQPMSLTEDPLVVGWQNEQLRLESLKVELPETMKQALGVAALQMHYQEASEHLEKMKAASREVEVTAPVYGVVGQVRYSQGDQLPQGDVMLRILHAERYIVVNLPTRRIHEMQMGREVELVFPGDEEYRGRVADVPIMAEADHRGETHAVVRIERVGRVWPTLPVGSHVDVISLQ